jgi:putative Holliday junction resolvase
MPTAKTLLALDVGEKRIGVALADTGVRIAMPFDTIEVDGNEIAAIAEIIVRENIDAIVVGYPRNQAGLPTQQTAYVVEFSKQLEGLELPVEFQDESLTSVVAEDWLKAHKRPYTKGDIDAQAAAIILQDYIEERYGV